MAVFVNSILSLRVKHQIQPKCLYFMFYLFECETVATIPSLRTRKPAKIMNPKLDRESFFLILVILVLSQIQACICQDDESYQKCSQPFQCADQEDIKYPFYGNDRPAYCGHPGFELDCKKEVPLITMNSVSYRVLSVDDNTYSLKVAREDLWNNICPEEPLHNTTLNFDLFSFSSISNDRNISLNYGCSGLSSQTQPQPSQTPAFFPFTCGPYGLSMISTLESAVGLRSSLNCSSHVIVPVNQTAASDLATLLTGNTLKSGFSIQWSADNSSCQGCKESGGVCGSNQDSKSFACYCPKGTSPFTCNNNGNGKGSGSSNGFLGMKQLMIGLLLGIASVVTLLALAVYIRRARKLSRYRASNGTHQNVEFFLLNQGSLAPKRYSYKEINKITKSFSDKIGEGGYGSVYKGMLPKPDGQLVAVKLLTKTMSDGDEFINEVASISRTSHVNIVNLLGFCYERKKRALVYEFMPNKSLDKFIYENGSLSQLGWERMYKIAIGVARGLEYLHKGCNTRIVHFDIKPENILLDEDFCPKISDFGLAKLCGKKQSILSMLGTRGTIGYIAPEVFSRQFGGVSHKSDVYSYGMVVLDMAGARHNIVGVGSTRSSESYFPDEIYKHVMLHRASNLDDIEIADDEEISMKMLLVAFWCIQTVPSDRPSISKVVEMLEGSLEHIQIPPKPLLYAPEAPRLESSSLESLHVETESSVES